MTKTMLEIWKPMVGYEGLYEVSNLGRIRSLPHKIRVRNGHFATTRQYYIKFYKMKNGYLAFRPSKDGKMYHCLVHRAVATAFINNSENKLEVNHIDGDKSNNRFSNLEWVTSSENKCHAFNTGLKTITERQKRLAKEKTAKKVRCVETGDIFSSIKSAAIFAGVARETVRDAVNKKAGHKTAGGFHWEFYDIL